MAGQELTRQTRDEEAIPYFKRATELDPNFGRAYSAWGTAAFKIGRQDEAEANHKKALSLLDRMTERERYRTLGVYYLAVSKNYDKAIENFSTLVKEYPSDAAAYNNLAVAYTNKLDFPNASENGRKALEIYPRNRLYRSNYARTSNTLAISRRQRRSGQPAEEDPNCFTLPAARHSRLVAGRGRRGRRLLHADGQGQCAGGVTGQHRVGRSRLVRGAKTRSICSPPGFAPTRRPRLSPERQ